jgi:hypothetical protein
MASKITELRSIVTKMATVERRQERLATATIEADLELNDLQSELARVSDQGAAVPHQQNGVTASEPAHATAVPTTTPVTESKTDSLKEAPAPKPVTTLGKKAASK